MITPSDTFGPGVKLKVFSRGSWRNVTVVTTNSDATITCNMDESPESTFKILRSDLVIDGGQTEMAASVVSSDPPSRPTLDTLSQSGAQKPRLKRYKVTIPVPQGYSIVDEKCRCQSRTKLKACYAGHWEFVTVEEVNEDGTLTCNWDNWKGFTYKMVRKILQFQTKIDGKNGQQSSRPGVQGTFIVPMGPLAIRVPSQIWETISRIRARRPSDASGESSMGNEVAVW